MTGEIVPQNQAIVAIKRSLAPRIQDIGRKLGENVDVKRYLNVCLSQFEHNPKLCECTPISIYHALIQAADLGIIPNGVIGQGYLIPYRIKGVMTCTFQPGYQGLVDLVWRSGMVEVIHSQVVYKDDQFEYNAVRPWETRHVPAETGNRDKSNIRGIYAQALAKGSTFPMLEWWTFDQIEEHKRKYSRAWDKPDSPWQTDWIAMAKKTVLKQLIKLLPKSADVRVQKAIALDSLAERGLAQNIAFTDDDFIDTTAEEVPQDAQEPPQDAPGDDFPPEDEPEPERAPQRKADPLNWEIEQYVKALDMTADEFDELVHAFEITATDFASMKPGNKAALAKALKQKVERKGK